MRDVIRQKIADALAFMPPPLTRRDARPPAIPGKARAVVGMRRSGKTCFLHQCLADRLATGTPREALVYFSFEDERLAGMEAGQLSWVLEEYFSRCPQFRDHRQVTFFFDEIQTVPGWEAFIRRVLDTEKVEVFVSGSSARLLSREVATALRGRATETIIFPFSFREYLRHHRIEAPANPGFVPKAQRSRLERAFADYLTTGGFPEAQGLSARDRVVLLQSYVDTCIFRDVVERHGITNVVALRRLVRLLLGAAAGHFSVSKFYNDLRSQGVPVAKDALHQMLAHLEDAFLVRLVPLATSSERQRQVNPRKVYPVDPALIAAFDRSGKVNQGHALETAVLVELQRRGGDAGYMFTPGGFEVDFLASEPDGGRTLIQVAADLSDPTTRAREFRALTDALPAHRRAPALLLTLTGSDVLAAQADAPASVTVRTAWEWMLESEPLDDSLPRTGAKRPK
jgi:predicted AAA+ superfamily ATPase